MKRPRVLSSISPYHLLVAGIFVLALFLRLYGWNWDQGTYLHPDERFIAIVTSDRVYMPPLSDIDQIFDPAHSPLNPRRDDANGNPESFAYGSLPIYVQGTISWLISHSTATDFGTYPEVYRIGRPLTALVDMLTLLVVFLLARRLAGRHAALVAAALYAFAVLPIQLSHFFTVDVWLTCFVTASLYFAVRYTDSPTLPRALVLALPVGCAFATKASVPSLLVPLFAAFAWVTWHARDRIVPIGHAAAAAILALAIFTVFEPYALVRSKPFLDDIRLQAKIVRGQFDVPFTRQFVGLTPGLYELRNLFLFTAGPGLLLAGIFGIPGAITRILRDRDIAWSVLLLWIVAYVPTLLITEARFLRYSLPLLPGCAILAAAMLVRLPRVGRVPLARIATATVLIVTVAWGLGFTKVYSGANPRIAASEWMFSNIPAGSAITAESWDDAMPIPYPGSPPNTFRLVGSDIYQDEPPEQKVSSIAATLAQADYVVLSSDRVIESVDNLPWRYAVQNEYYRRLLAGQLGFQLVYDGELRPQLFGYRYDDSSADESLTVYDHPRVRIFKKVTPLSEDEIRDRLLWGINQPWEPQRYPSQQWLELDGPADTITVTTDASWNHLATNSSLFAIVSWLVVIEMLGIAALPLAAAVLPRTRDRGAATARLFGLVIVGWLVWIGASLSFWEARTPTIIVFTAFLSLVSWGYVELRARAGRPILLPDHRTWLNWAGLWLGTFAAFLLLRALYPDFWQTWFGGEKPFELAYLRSISRSVEFPPYDPWYSGGTINYYYYGWHLVTTLAKMSGVGVSLAFQFAIPTFAGLLTLQIASFAGLVTGRGRRRVERKRALIASVLAVVALLVIGNLDALRQVLEDRGAVRDRFDFWRSTRVIDYTINEFPWFSQIWADVHPHVINFPVVLLLLTLLAHLVLDARTNRPETMQTWVRRSLGVGVALSLTLGTIAVTNAWDAPLMIAITGAAWLYAGWLHSRRSAIEGIVIAICVVGLAFVLYWPFYAGFYSVVQGLNIAESGSRLGQFMTVWGIFFGIVFITLAGEALRDKSQADERRDGWLFSGITILAGGMAIGLSVFVSRLGTATLASLIALLLAAGIIGLSAVSSQPSRLRPLLLEPLIVLVVIAGGISVWRPAAAVVLGVAAATMMQAIPQLQRPRRALPWLLIAIASIVISSTEIVYVADDLQQSSWERMNTVFKFYLQAWILLSLGATLLLARLIFSSRADGLQRPTTSRLGITTDVPPRMTTSESVPLPRQPSTSMRVWAAIGAGLLALGLLYPVLGTPVRLDQDMPSSPSGLSLDGYAWMKGGQIFNGSGEVLDFTGDLAAIEWLNTNAQGNPILLEASIGPYRGNGSRISSATGLPTVLGWDRHQRQQRYGPGIDARMRDVREIYNETDPERKLELLRRYAVTYVIVGDVERLWNTPEDQQHYASAEGLAAFDALQSRGLYLVFESGHTRIYALQDFPRIPASVEALHAQ